MTVAPPSDSGSPKLMVSESASPGLTPTDTSVGGSAICCGTSVGAAVRAGPAPNALTAATRTEYATPGSRSVIVYASASASTRAEP